MTAATPPALTSAARPPASPTDLFLVFNGLALRGFGGVLPFAQRTLVEQRAWMSNDQFVEMLRPHYDGRIVVGDIGPVVGTHAGRGTIGVAFQER